MPDPWKDPLDWSTLPEVIRGMAKYADVLGIYLGVQYYDFIDSPEFPLELAQEANVYTWTHYREIQAFIDENDYTDKTKTYWMHSRRCEMTMHCLALANDLNKFE